MVREQVGGMDWIHLTWARDQWQALVSTEREVQVP
jgi:hypothetical protein